MRVKAVSVVDRNIRSGVDVVFFLVDIEYTLYNVSGLRTELTLEIRVPQGGGVNLVSRLLSAGEDTGEESTDSIGRVVHFRVDVNVPVTRVEVQGFRDPSKGDLLIVHTSLGRTDGEEAEEAEEAEEVETVALTSPMCRGDGLRAAKEAFPEHDITYTWIC